MTNVTGMYSKIYNKIEKGEKVRSEIKMRKARKKSLNDKRHRADLRI